MVSLIIVMPVNNAVNERSFSTMRRIKSCLLNHTMVLKVYMEELDNLDIANEFVDKSERSRTSRFFFN